VPTKPDLARFDNNIEKELTIPKNEMAATWALRWVSKNSFTFNIFVEMVQVINKLASWPT